MKEEKNYRIVLECLYCRKRTVKTFGDVEEIINHGAYTCERDGSPLNAVEVKRTPKLRLVRR